MSHSLAALKLWSLLLSCFFLLSVRYVSVHNAVRKYAEAGDAVAVPSSCARASGETSARSGPFRAVVTVSAPVHWWWSAAQPPRDQTNKSWKHNWSYSFPSRYRRRRRTYFQFFRNGPSWNTAYCFHLHRDAINSVPLPLPVSHSCVCCTMKPPGARLSMLYGVS